LARPGTYPRAEHLKGASLEHVLALPAKHLIRQERLARVKHSSLSQTLINYGHKKFFNIEPRAQCYKRFFPCKYMSFPVFTGKNTDCNAINTFYLYLQEEFTDKIYRRISPVITGVFL
jgi:hypothetical protein